MTTDTKSDPSVSNIKFRTSCKNCVFAIYDEDTQTDCGLGRIDKFGDCVIEAYDDEKEFYLIEGRQCLAKRTYDWASKNRDIYRKIKEELVLMYSLILEADESNAEYIADTVNQLEITPQKLILINRTGENYSRVFLKKYRPRWEIINTLDKQKSNEWYIHQAALSGKIKSVFYLYVRNVGIANETISDLNHRINYDLEQIKEENTDDYIFRMTILHTYIEN